MEDTQILEQILKRLNILISLELLRMDESSAVTMSTRIRSLANLGLPPSEIAEIIGKPLNYVTATLSRKKKSQDKGRKKQ